MKQRTRDKKGCREEVPAKNADTSVKFFGRVTEHTAGESVVDAPTHASGEKDVVQDTSIILVDDGKACVSERAAVALATDRGLLHGNGNVGRLYSALEAEKEELSDEPIDWLEVLVDIRKEENVYLHFELRIENAKRAWAFVESIRLKRDKREAEKKKKAVVRQKADILSAQNKRSRKQYHTKDAVAANEDAELRDAILATHIARLAEQLTIERKENSRCLNGVPKKSKLGERMKKVLHVHVADLSPFRTEHGKVVVE